MGPGNKVTEVTKRYEKHKHEFPTKKGIAGRWDIPLADQVKDVGEPYRSYYLMSYLFPTMHMHATATSVYSKYTINEKNESVSREQPDHQEILATLIQTHALYLQVLKDQIEVFELPLNDEFRSCAVALPRTWNLGTIDSPDGGG